MLTTHEAFEARTGDGAAGVFLLCEHATERLPSPWRWPDEDEHLKGTHWAFDPGARALTLELASALNAGAVLARHTRLLIDPNRDELHRDLFRLVADGQEVALNRALSGPERTIRLERYYRAFHFAVDRALTRDPAPVLLSLHTFSALYEGEARSMAMGVLFNDDEPAARRLGAHLEQEFSGVAYNEPWSGREGLMYSVETHARRHRRVAIELELRNDLALDPRFRGRLVASLVRYFSPSRPTSSERLQGR